MPFERKEFESGQIHALRDSVSIGLKACLAANSEILPQLHWGLPHSFSLTLHSKNQSKDCKFLLFN